MKYGYNNTIKIYKPIVFRFNKMVHVASCALISYLNVAICYIKCHIKKRCHGQCIDVLIN